ncbi:helix-turn-helix domain-containing protein [Cytobacillus solani]|uniref:helix-turn-helix domain-containing protein n=1 Tax=Cytobacillus solani TaxID=1637975 RepID=UPI001151A19F|nr:helix-turn-helix domain-containing protein [Cytobacillus solani]
MNEPNLARDIKALRTKRGIGSRELSRLIEKAPTYISQLERGLIKNPDPKTLVEIFKHLGHRREYIDDFLFSTYNISTPDQIEAEEAWTRQQIENAQDPDYQEHLLEMQIEQYEREMEWLESIEHGLHKKNEEINKELTFFIDKNLDTFTGVINNLHTMVMTLSKSREDYVFFTNLFKRDLTEFSEDSKERIIELIKEEYDKSLIEKGWIGERPPF